jgi:hypothetical protein
MNESIERDEELDALLDAWAAPQCPDGFAERAVSRALSDRRVSRPPGRPGLVVPLLLVAMLVSLGAWAGLEASRDDSPAGAPETAPSSVKAKHISFELVAGTTYAEPELETEEEQGPSKPARQDKRSDPDTDGEAQSTKPPPVVHWPRCECGTSAVVCTCSD